MQQRDKAEHVGDYRVTGLYSIYDRVAMDYGPTFEASNNGIAVRNFQSAIKDNPFASDFILYSLGHIERSSSMVLIHPSQAPVQIETSILQDVENVVNA